MEIESGLLGGLEQSVEVIAQACFGLFASPGHGMLRISFDNPTILMMAS
jgi:hypothetical protein